MRIIRKFFKCDKGGTLLTVLAIFIPVSLLILTVSFAFSNYFSILQKIKITTVESYVAQNGIERYINEIKNNQTFAEPLGFTNISDGVDYTIDVTSERPLDMPDKIIVTSKVTGSGYTCVKVIDLSRIIE